MVDRDARDQLAFALRQLASGLMSNDKFTDEVFGELCNRNDDPALAELAAFGWLHYSDTRTSHRLRGRHALSPECRKDIARAVLFLKTDQEYVHSDSLRSGTILSRTAVRLFLTTIALALLAGALAHFLVGKFWLGLGAFLVLGYLGHLAFISVMHAVLHRRWRDAVLPDTFWPYLDARASMEAFRFWPFASNTEYDAALANPPYLCGSVAPITCSRQLG